MKESKYLLVVLICALSHCLAGQEMLFINSGELVLKDSIHFDYFAFNKTNVFNATSRFYHLNLNDTLKLDIVNNDSNQHHLVIDNEEFEIPANDTLSLIISKTESSIISIYDEHDYINGLSTFIVFDENNNGANNYYWLFHEHIKLHDERHVEDTTEYQEALEYYPEYFTINAKEMTYLQNDSLATINASVGDSVIIYAFNGGKTNHPMHFHGFHATTLLSTKYPHHIGREKDTFPIERLQAIKLLMIPDKKGVYPVHNHNLIGVTSAGQYPDGQLIFMTIN